MRKLTSERNEQIAKRFKQGASEETLAAEYDIGLTYIRTILREQGLIKKKPREDLNNRNQAVRDMFRKGNTPEQIAEEMELTTTRIRQIIQEDSAAAMEMRQEELQKAKEKAVKMIAAGNTAKEIEDAIGLTAVKRLKYRFNFNIFKLVVQRKAERALELYNKGMKPTEISTELGCTSDYVYGLLRGQGVKFDIPKEEKELRNKDIFAFMEKNGGNVSVSVKKAAEKYNLSEVMIKFIYEKQKRQITKNDKKSTNPA